MIFDWFRGKTYTVRCPDGSVRNVYRNLDDACPLFISGWSSDLGVNLKGFEDLSGEAKLKYEKEIESTLYSLNELNQSLMMSFRTVYLTFTTNPCANDEFLQREISKLLDEQRKLAALKMQLTTIIQLASRNPTDFVAITKIFGEIAARLGGPASAPAAVIEIQDARNAAKSLIRNG